MTIFDLPASEVYTVTVQQYLCSRCGRRAGPITFKALASDKYICRDGIRRRGFYFHNPVCACEEAIWLDDGPVTF